MLYCMGSVVLWGVCRIMGYVLYCMGFVILYCIEGMCCVVWADLGRRRSERCQCPRGGLREGRKGVEVKGGRGKGGGEGTERMEGRGRG